MWKKLPVVGLRNGMDGGRRRGNILCLFNLYSASLGYYYVYYSLRAIGPEDTRLVSRSRLVAEAEVGLTTVMIAVTGSTWMRLVLAHRAVKKKWQSIPRKPPQLCCCSSRTRREQYAAFRKPPRLKRITRCCLRGCWPPLDIFFDFC